MMEQAKQIEAIKSILSFKNYSCLYVENVSRNYPYKDLKECFNKYGAVKNIRINIDQLTGRYMGSVLIYFE
jgi:RNA recognition motif-containing protein